MEVPQTEQTLLKRATQLAGLTLDEVAAVQGQGVPSNTLHAKGWTGQLVERALGADSGSLSQPDFPHLGIELKTLPILPGGIPTETTYVCIVPLREGSPVSWKNSILYRKLNTILWIPIEADPKIPLPKRHIGMPLLWHLPHEDEKILKKDWEEFSELICLGKVGSITAHQGTYLQIRPKAAHSRIKTEGIGPDGEKIYTLPKGFYLRKCFTQKIIQKYFAV